MSEIGFARPEPVGDTAVAIRVAGSSAAEMLGRVRGLADAIQAASIPGVTDVVAAPGRVTVAYDPLVIADVDAFRRTVAAAAAAAAGTSDGEPVVHEIPVAYDGPDLDEVCAGHGIDRTKLISSHTAPDYLVEAIGFLPGFGYLSGLPADLATPRRATPRRLVPAGAVGIGGGQTGVYPFASPGGWNLVGRSPVTLFDVRRPRPALLAVGDRVRFVAADLPPAAEPEPAAEALAQDAMITVVQPGLFTTIQDIGRPGLRSAGVPLSGAADPVSLRLANLLVGNPEAAAAIECTLLGPTLRFERDAVVALVGGAFPGMPGGVATRLPAGTQLALGHAITGCRGYLAVAGGIDVEAVLGSRSTLVVAGFGGLAGRPLRAGDRLAVGSGFANRSRGLPAHNDRAAAMVRRLADPRLAEAAGFQSADEGGRPRDQPTILRIIPGEQAEAFGGRPWSQLFRASSRSDRMGVRLEGEPLPGAAGGGGLASVAVFPGTVQVPPDGLPIVLVADAQTIGGYPVLGQVIAADVPRAAQLRPGAEVRFEPVSLAEAHTALRARETLVAAVREAAR